MALFTQILWQGRQRKACQAAAGIQNSQEIYILCLVWMSKVPPSFQISCEWCSLNAKGNKIRQTLLSQEVKPWFEIRLCNLLEVRLRLISSDRLIRKGEVSKRCEYFSNPDNKGKTASIESIGGGRRQKGVNLTLSRVACGRELTKAKLGWARAK